MHRGAVLYPWFCNMLVKMTLEIDVCPGGAELDREGWRPCAVQQGFCLFVSVLFGEIFLLTWCD